MKAAERLRNAAKACGVLLLGGRTRPRTIMRGLASGYRICVSPVQNFSYLVGTAEPHLQRAIKDYVVPGDTVYDIGAYVGYASLSLAKRVGPSGRVFAFEPLPGNADLLRQSVEANRLTNIQIFALAASDRGGEALIRVAENRATASIVWHRNNPSAVELAIKTVAIDDLVQAGQLCLPKFVKIDVEGAEGRVVHGMRCTVAHARPVIFMECSEAGRQTTWRFFSELHYRCQSAMTRKWVQSFEEYRHSDFLWLP